MAGPCREKSNVLISLAVVDYQRVADTPLYVASCFMNGVPDNTVCGKTEIIPTLLPLLFREVSPIAAADTENGRGNKKMINFGGEKITHARDAFVINP